MEHITLFLSIILAAIVMQNAFIMRGLGANKNTLLISSPRRIFLYGAVLTTVCSLSALISWPINYFFLRGPQLEERLSLRYLVTLGCICLVYLLLWYLTWEKAPRLHYHLRELYASATFNCAVLGSLLLAFSENYNLLHTFGFAFGSGVGYTLAILLIYEGRRRIVLSEVPRAFRGLPIILLYTGILSMAIYGLIGHQLPT